MSPRSPSAIARGVVVSIALTFTATGCASTSTGGTAENGAAGAATIDIRDFAYTMATAEPGSTVTVENADSAPHTVSADDGTGASFDVEIDGGATATFTAPEEGGDYAYHCRFHPDMHGTLTVSS